MTSSTKLRSNAADLCRLMRLDKPIGILLLLWPTLIALMIAGHGRPPWPIVSRFVLGVVLMRCAGCVLNDLADAKIDPHVERTKHRPLAEKRIATTEALILVAILIFISASLIIELNRLTQQLACVAALVAGLYPFMKRIIEVPQLILGLAFSMGIPMSFTALHNEVPMVSYQLIIANLFWVLAYDTQYALADIKDDRKIGVKSTAILFGNQVESMILICQTLSLSIYGWVGWQQQFKLPYFIGVTSLLGFVVYQAYLIHVDSEKNAIKAFLNNNLLGAVLFGSVFLAYHNAI